MSRLQSIKSAVRGEPWRKGAGPTDVSIYELLKTDHEQIHNICKNILQEEDARSERVWTLFLELRELVIAHTKTEELVFYNTLHDRSLEAEDEELRFDVMEGFEEHHLAHLLIAEVGELDRRSERWMAKMRVLSETLQRHFEREESEMFESAKRNLETRESQNLAEEFLEEKDALAKLTH